MDLARPQRALCPTLDSEVLAALSRTTRPMTGREVARLVGRGQEGVRRVLHRLVEHGLVQAQEAGPALLYTLNRDHIAAPAVEIMANLRGELFRRIRAALADWATPPFHASIFGSAARGDGATSSDIDLFIVRPDGVSDDDPTWLSQVDRLAVEVRRWTGNTLGISEVSRRDVARLRSDNPPVAADIRSDAVTLAGPPAAELLGGGG